MVALNFKFNLFSQSICIIAADHHERRTEYEAKKPADAQPLPSIVVCPSTLTSHWYYEIKKFCDNLKAICYVGPPRVRRALLPELPQNDVIIVSYDVLRNDVQYFEPFQYNYCVLDEGHIIRGPHTKMTKVRRRVKASEIGAGFFFRRRDASIQERRFSFAGLIHFSFIL